MVRFLRSSAAKFVAVFSGPVGALPTIYGFFSHGKVVPLWSGLICMIFAALVAVYRAIGERETEIWEAHDLMLAQRREFTSLIDGLNADLRRQEEQAASDRSHYETELTLLENAIAVPTVSLVREPDPRHSKAQVFVLVNKSNAEATSITVCDLVIPIPPRATDNPKQRRLEAESQSVFHGSLSELSDDAPGTRRESAYILPLVSSSSGATRTRLPTT